MTNSLTNNNQQKTWGNHIVNLLIATIGMLVASSGNLLTHYPLLQKECYLIGATLMLISSIMERQPFFVGLQLILVIGTTIAFTDLAVWLKAGIPILLSILVIIYFICRGWLRNGLTAFGCFGMAILAAGYAIFNPIVYLTGALALMIYSFISYRRGVTVALLWAILNAVFAVTASMAIYHQFAH